MTIESRNLEVASLNVVLKYTAILHWELLSADYFNMWTYSYETFWNTKMQFLNKLK